VDGSRDADDLQAEVKALVTRAQALRDLDAPPPVVRGLAPQPEEAVEEAADVRPNSAPSGVVPRRSGLGKGLESLIPDAADQPAPGHLVSIDLTQPPSLEMIAIEESASGVMVRAVDTARNIAEAKVIGGASSVNPAIVGAVAELLGEQPPPRLASVELRDTEVAAVLVVTLELADTTVTAGAAVVQGGMPFTLGKAAWSAIQSARR